MADLVGSTRFYAHEGNHYLIRDIVSGKDGKHVRCEAGMVSENGGTVSWEPCAEGSSFGDLPPIIAQH